MEPCLSSRKTIVGEQNDDILRPDTELYDGKHQHRLQSRANHSTLEMPGQGKQGRRSTDVRKVILTASPRSAEHDYFRSACLGRLYTGVNICPRRKALLGHQQGYDLGDSKTYIENVRLNCSWQAEIHQSFLQITGAPARLGQTILRLKYHEQLTPRM
jgi:hypothetical protein